MKNLIYSITEKTKDGEYKKVFSIARMKALGMFNKNLTDGEYPFFIKSSTLGYTEDEIPAHPQVRYETQHIKLADFECDMVSQVVSGVLRIKNGRLDTKHLDKQIPSAYHRYNSHIFLERMWVSKDGVIELSMGS